MADGRVPFLSSYAASSPLSGSCGHTLTSDGELCPVGGRPLQSYKDLARMHAYLLTASSMLPTLPERLYRKLVDEAFNGGKVVAVKTCEGGSQRRLTLVVEDILEREFDIFLIDQAWSSSGSLMRSSMSSGGQAPVRRC